MKSYLYRNIEMSFLLSTNKYKMRPCVGKQRNKCACSLH